MADHAEPGKAPVGSVAEETARLLDALLGGAPGPRPDAPAAAACPSCGAPDGAGAGSPPPPPPPPPTPPSTCHLCPVCQLLQVARAVRPDTVDRLADLAGALTEMLREVAAARRSEHQAHGSADGATPGAHGADVEDIVVGTGDDLDEEPDDDHELDDEPDHDPATRPDESRR